MKGGGAMLYFGPPTRFATGVEQLVIDTVHRLLPAALSGGKYEINGRDVPHASRFTMLERIPIC